MKKINIEKLTQEQIEQKDLLCCVEGKVKFVILSSPDIHFNLAEEEKRLAP